MSKKHFTKKYKEDKQSLEIEAARKKSGIEEKVLPVDSADHDHDPELEEIIKKYAEHKKANEFNFTSPPRGVRRRQDVLYSADVSHLADNSGVLGNPNKKSRN